MRGFAGRLTDARKVFAQQELVDDRRFSDVRLAGKRNLHQTVLRAVGNGGH